ncbi:MAG TPA: electron transfer flavoprotein subunit beta/FixA family protein [Chloroflexota bacterium]|jgi:electron transfer flavoprotein beta subunit|nr:electron transfer flavoprotein subunit beta/FixA family protein [Chloroflexota bacterium]
MHIVVTIKQVPDTSEVRIDPKTNTMVRGGVPSIVNPDDTHAIEEAVRLKERHGGRVTVLSMGPPQAIAALREAISYGADEAVLCSDRGFAAADTLATSYVLWAAIRKLDEEEPVDLVLAGKQAIDGDTGQVPPGVATRLGWPQLTYVRRILEFDPQARRIRVERLADGGIELLESRLPAVVTVGREINEPRYASLPNMLRAARYQPRIWDRKTLNLDETKIGLRGSPTIVSKVWAPPRRQRPPVIMLSHGDRDPDAVAADLLDRLIADGAFDWAPTPAPAAR